MSSESKKSMCSDSTSDSPLLRAAAAPGVGWLVRVILNWGEVCRDAQWRSRAGVLSVELLSTKMRCNGRYVCARMLCSVLSTTSARLYTGMTMLKGVFILCAKVVIFS